MVVDPERRMCVALEGGQKVSTGLEVLAVGLCNWFLLFGPDATQMRTAVT